MFVGLEKTQSPAFLYSLEYPRTNVFTMRMHHGHTHFLPLMALYQAESALPIRAQDVSVSGRGNPIRIPYFSLITLARGHIATTMFWVSIDQPGSPLPCTQVDSTFLTERMTNRQLLVWVDLALPVGANRPFERGKASSAKSRVIRITTAQLPAVDGSGTIYCRPPFFLSCLFLLGAQL